MEKKEEKKQRLCSEIQLFDLCDKTDCGAREGRFCTDPVILAKFEKLAGEEEPPQELLADDEDYEDEDDPEFSGEYDEDGAWDYEEDE